MDFEIKLLKDCPSAIPELVDLFLAEWTPWYGPGGNGNAEADLLSCLNSERLPIAVVARSKDGQTLGTAALKDTSLGAEHGYGPWLAAVVVVPDVRGRGIGTALIQSVEEHARRLGFPEIYTSTDSANSIVLRRGWEPMNRDVQSLRGPISIYRLSLI